MGEFFIWFLIIAGVLAIFNAESLPALGKLLESKLKTSMEAAKTGAQTAKTKIEKVKTEIDARKNSMPKKRDDNDEDSPEETAEALKFMSDYVDKNKSSKK